MPLSRHARVALGTVLLITVAGLVVPGASTTRSISPAAALLDTSRRLHIPEVESVSRRGHAIAVRYETPEPTPTPIPAPAPPPPPPPPPGPPIVGNLRLLVDHPVFSDHSGDHGGAPAMQARAGILVDIDTRQILWEVNPHESLPPASTTKVVSSLLALNNFSPHKAVTITPDALTQASDETRMGIVAGQQYTVEELLSGMLTVSANDAATAMAVDTVGFDDYVGAMNAQIQALGLHDSHFTTPVGLDDPAQYASPYDLAAVAMEDWTRFAVFRNIVGRQQVNLPQTAGHPRFALPNLNRLLQFYAAAVGIKPGWTGNAGPCLVGMAERNGHRLIAVVMNDPKLYTDETNLFQWGFAQYGIRPW